MHELRENVDILCLSFNPLFALRIALRECDVFFFGTANTKGGKSSNKDWSEGIVHARGFGARKAAGSRRARENLRAGTLKSDCVCVRASDAILSHEKGRRRIRTECE